MIESLQDHIRSCRQCGLARTCTAPVPGLGASPAALMVVGEAPGGQEDRRGKPFVGKSGRELWNRYLLYSGIDPDTVYVSNTVHCRPPEDADPLPEEIEACRGWLLSEILTCDPKVIIACGAFATRWFLGEDADLVKVNGLPMIWEGRTVIPTFHPAYAMHEGSTIHGATIQSAFHLAAKALRGEPVDRPHDICAGNENYVYVDTQPKTVHMADHLHQACTIAVDTETTPSGEPHWVQVSSDAGSAYIVPVDNIAAIGCIKAKLQDKRTLTVMHNALFDLKALASLRIYPAKVADTMTASWLLQLLPQGLKPLAYRLCGMEMDSYTEVVADADRRLALAYLRSISETIWPQSEPMKVWDFRKGKWGWFTKQPQPLITEKIDTKIKWDHQCEFVRKRIDGKLVVQLKCKKIKRGREHTVRRTGKLLRLLDDCNKNPELNPRERWMNMIADDPIAPFIQQMKGPMPRAYLADANKQRARRYAARDADATLRVWDAISPQLEDLGLMDVFWSEMDILPICQAMMDNGMLINADKFHALTEEFSGEMERLNAEIDIHSHRSHINPASPKQVAEFLYGELGLPIRKYTTREQTTPSTDADSLSMLKGLHPVIEPLLAYKKLEKLVGTYTRPLPEMADRHGRVHPTLKLTRTATGRLACAGPNLQNQPVRTAEGKKIRGAYEAPPGSLIASVDYSQIEPRLAAHVSMDPDMLRNYREGLDIYCMTAERIFGCPYDEVPKKRRDQSKVILLATFYGMSAKTLYDRLEVLDVPASEDECELFLAEIERAYPQLTIYFQNKLSEGLRYGYVRDLFNRIYYVPELKSTDRRIREEGKRYTRNYPIQGGAQGILKRAMARCWPVCRRLDKQAWCKPIMQVHDEMLFEVHHTLLDRFATEISEAMIGAVELAVPLNIDIEVGPDWGHLVDYNEWKKENG